MQDKLKKFLNQTSDKWKQLEKQQKIRLILTGIIVFITLGATVYFITKPNWVVLTRNIDVVTAGQIQNELNEAGISNRLRNNGTAIEIYSRDQDKATIHLAQSNVASQATFTYESAIDLSGMGSTETIKKANLRRAHASELARNLQSFEGVNSAQVTLVVPDETNFFIESQGKASASVFLETNRAFNQAQSVAIARYIARSTRGLEMENIEIVDQNAQIIYSGTEEQFANEGRNFDSEQLRKQEIDARIQASLAPLYDEVRIISNLSFNWDQAQIQSERYAPPITGNEGGGVLNETLERQRVTNGNAEGEPGVGANDQTGATYQMGNAEASSANINNSTTNYLWNRELEERQISAAGLVPERSSISVLVYKYRNFHEEYMVSNNLLNGLTWEQFKAEQVTNEIEVSENLVESLRTGTGIATLSVLAHEIPVFYDKEVIPLQIEQILMFAILAILILLLAFGLIRRTIQDEVIEVEPELSVEELLVSSEIEENEEKRLKEISINGDSEVKRQLEKFALEKPEAMAQLLRNWLHDGLE